MLSASHLFNDYGFQTFMIIKIYPVLLMPFTCVLIYQSDYFTGNIFVTFNTISLKVT